MEEYGKKWIRQGMEVAHKDDPSKKLYVDHIKTEVKKIPTGQAESDGRPVYENRVRVIGVQVRFMEDSKWKFMRFHTRELVPWDVAQKGIKSIIAFMEREV